jgi:hypothetical protein
MMRRLIAAMRLVDKLRLIAYPVIAGGPHARVGSQDMRRMVELWRFATWPGGLVASTYLILSGEQTKSYAAASGLGFCRYSIALCSAKVLNTSCPQCNSPMSRLHHKTAVPGTAAVPCVEGHAAVLMLQSPNDRFSGAHHSVSCSDERWQ